MTRSETPATPAPRELTAAEMEQAGGGRIETEKDPVFVIIGGQTRTSSPLLHSALVSNENRS